MEPCKYTMKLLFGCMMAAASIVFITHMFRYMSLNVDGKTIGPFLNAMFIKLETSPVRFLSSLILVLCGYYVLASAVLGNIKFGLRFFFISFYPVMPKETFVNAFMANCLVFNIYSVAVSAFLCQAFDCYIAGTAAAKIWNVQVRYMQIWSWLYTHNFFIVWMIVWWFIAFIYFCLKPVEKIDLGMGTKKADLQSKQ